MSFIGGLRKTNQSVGKSNQIFESPEFSPLMLILANAAIEDFSLIGSAVVSLLSNQIRLLCLSLWWELSILGG